METVHRQKQRELLILFFLGVYLLIVMLCCAGTSPVIDCINSDSAVFFMVGRGMANGKIPYLDMFDHKGWYIYLIDYLGVLLDPSGSFGLFLVEYLVFYLSILLVYKTYTELYKDQSSKTTSGAIVASMACAALFLNHATYQYGNLVEEYCLPLQLVSCLLLVRFSLSRKETHPPKYMLVHGICAGVAFGLRANMILFWAAIAIVVLIESAAGKHYRALLFNILSGLLGVVIGCLPPFLYAVATNCLPDMIYQTIVFNMLYSGSRGSFFSNILRLLLHPLVSTTFAMCFISSVILVRNRQIRKSLKFIYIIGLAFSLVSVLLSGRYYGHYYEHLLVFLIPSVFLLVRKTGKHLSKKCIPFKILYICCIFAITIGLNLSLPIRVIRHMPSRYTKAVDAFNNIYQDIADSDITVFVTGNNCIFYNELGAFPKTKYFYTPSISYDLFPTAIDSQVQSILSGENDVIILDYTEGKIIKRRPEYDSSILCFLNSAYELKSEVKGFQMWVRK